MSPSAFYQFFHLPYELRELIWLFAIRPAGHAGAIHHIIWGSEEGADGSLDSDTFIKVYHWEKTLNEFEAACVGVLPGQKTVVSKLAHPRSNSAPSVTFGRQSACFWDSGLWTACKESRAIIMKQKLKLCNQKGLSAGAVLRKRVLQHQLSDTISEEWHILVDRSNDLLCYTFQDEDFLRFLNSNIGEDLRIRLQIPLVDFQYHIGVEFDPSWDDPWPESLYDSLKEPSTRGLLLRMVHESWISEGNFIWIIDNDEESDEYWLADKQPPQFPPSEFEAVQSQRRIFCDMDFEVEYVEAWNSLKGCSFIDGLHMQRQSLQESAYWYRRCYSDYYDSYDDSDDDLTSTENYIGVLKRRKIKY